MYKVSTKAKALLTLRERERAYVESRDKNSKLCFSDWYVYILIYIQQLVLNTFIKEKKNGNKKSFQAMRKLGKKERKSHLLTQVKEAARTIWEGFNF